jgi:hypothetical protein
MFAFSSTGRGTEKVGEDVSAGSAQCLHFFSEQAKRPCGVGVLTNGAVHADIITHISDRYAPIIIF